MFSVSSPYPIFIDLSGSPLDNGLAYFGTANQNPETNPITVYWDEAGLIPAAQPIPIFNGVPTRNGSAANVFVTSDYSVTVRDASSRIVLAQQSSAVQGNELAADLASTASGKGAALVGFLAPSGNPATVDDLAGTGTDAGAELVGFKNSEISSAVASTLALRGSRNFWSVFDVMTAAEIADVRANTAAVDVTAKIQDIIDKAEAAGGKTIYFPEGTYKVGSTITINSNGVHLVGAGMWNCKISRSADYGSTFVFTGDDTTGTFKSDMSFVGFNITCTGGMTSGAHILVNGVVRMEIRNIRMFHGFIGIQCAAAGPVHIHNLYCVFSNLFSGSATGRRYMVFTAGNANYAKRECGDIYVSDFNVRGSVAGASGAFTEYGIYCDCADGIWFNNGHIGNTTVANILLSATTAGIPVSLLYFSNVMGDDNIGSNLRFEGNTIAGRHINFSNCTLKGGGNSQFGISNGTNAVFYNVTFDGGYIIEHTGHGVSLNSTGLRNISFSNVNVQGNSYGNSNVSNGYQLTSCEGVRITGGKSGGQNVIPDSAGDQANGITVGASALDVTITGVDLKHNQTTGLAINAASLSQVRVSNCDQGDSGSIASAGTITPGHVGKFFTITGTTTITSITASWQGHEIVLLFNSTAQVTDGSNLVLAGNFTGAANRMLSLVCDGTNWYETSRSAN